MTNTKSNQNNNIECAICYDKFNTSTISLTCGHKFDKKCIVEWFNRGNYTCPCCRANIPQPIVINVPQNKIDYKKRMYKSSSNFVISIFLILCIVLYSDIIQYKIHNKYVNSDADMLLIFLFMSDIFFTILSSNSLLLIFDGMDKLNLQIGVNDYMHYTNSDKNADSIFKGFYNYFLSMIFLIGLRIPAYCKSWKHLNNNYTDALYINMIISSVLHTVLFILMTYYFWTSYKYIKINAQIKRTAAPEPYP